LIVEHFFLVVILCGSEKFIRDFMLMAHQLHMTDGQYVYVVADQPTQNIRTPWVAGNDQDETARLAFESVLQVRVSLQTCWKPESYKYANINTLMQRWTLSKL